MRPGRPAGSWRDAAYVAVDFETTGLDLRRARPLSVGWVPVDGGTAALEGAGYSLIRWDGDVGPLPIHRLLPADLAVAPPAGEVADRLRAALAGRRVVAHGVAIERRMLARLGVQAPPGIDTVRLAEALARREGRQELAGRTLTALARALGVPVARPHHAFGDALTAAMAFLALAARLERAGAGSAADLWRLGRLHPFAGWRNG